MCLGIPGCIVEVGDPEKKLAVVDVGGVRRTINIACIVSDDHPAASCVGDWVLIHVGFAMARIDEEEAKRTLTLLHEMGELQAELDVMRTTAQN